MRTDRLNRLIAVLETVPSRQFNIHTWDCGTAACAAGWACRSPVFQAEGLHLHKSFSEQGYPVYEIDDERLSHFDALEVFFDLTNDQCLNIFASGAYPYRATPQDVINRIEELLACTTTKTT